LNAESWTLQLLLQPSVSLLVSGLMVNTLSTLCGIFTVQCVKLILIIFLKFGCDCLTVLSPKCNLSETFYQV